MERICKVCNQIKNTPYKDKCRACYQIFWMKKINPKTCTYCLSTFKLAGKICSACLRKKRLEKDKKPCSQCQRTGILILNRSDWLCTTCDRKKKDAEIAGFREKRIKQNRRFQRLYRGYCLEDLDKPAKEKSKGWWKTSCGYILIHNPKHPNANSKGCLFQHTFIMSEYLGRPLEKNETVHHKNGIRDDNRIENLELWHKGQPSGQRLEEKITWAKEFLEKYGYKII